jgi:hypothetical protein
LDFHAFIKSDAHLGLGILADPQKKKKRSLHC